LLEVLMSGHVLNLSRPETAVRPRAAAFRKAESVQQFGPTLEERNPLYSRTAGPRGARSGSQAGAPPR